MRSQLALAVLALAPASFAQQITLVDEAVSGGAPDLGALRPSLSDAGDCVVFESNSTDLHPGVSTGLWTVYARDMTTGQLEVVSESTAGTLADGESLQASVSRDGRFVAFASLASNLSSPAEVLGHYDVYLRDRVAGTTTRLSSSTTGGESNGASLFPKVSDDGTRVAFRSLASDLVAADTNGLDDVFVRDLSLGTTVLVSVGLGGAAANGASGRPSISGSGGHVAFTSSASNLVVGDTNGQTDVFVRDLAAGVTVRASVSSIGTQADSFSDWPVLTGDGRTVVFESFATNLVAGDTNGWQDVFARDLDAGTTTLVSQSQAGDLANYSSFQPEVSRNGRYVAFLAGSSNLTDPPTPNRTHGAVRIDRTTGEVQEVASSDCGLHVTPLATLALAPDGSYVAYASRAAHVVDDDVNGKYDVYLFDPLGSQSGTVCTYCNVAATSNGCLPTISATGTPSETAGSGFTVSVSSVEGQRSAIFVHSRGSKSTPWGVGGPSHLCVDVWGRFGTQTSGGTAGQCDGVLSADWNALRPGWARAGDPIFVQAWFRDPPSAKTTHLSNALSFVLMP